MRRTLLFLVTKKSPVQPPMPVPCASRNIICISLVLSMRRQLLTGRSLPLQSSIILAALTVSISSRTVREVSSVLKRIVRARIILFCTERRKFPRRKIFEKNQNSLKMIKRRGIVRTIHELPSQRRVWQNCLVSFLSSKLVLLRSLEKSKR